MKNSIFVLISIPFFLSLFSFSHSQYKNETTANSFLYGSHFDGNIAKFTKPKVELRCESNNGKVFTYSIPEDKITMIADVAGFGTANPIQFNVALPNPTAEVIHLGDNKPAVVYISVLDNYEFASDVEYDYHSFYTQDGPIYGDKAILNSINIQQSKFSNRVRKITISKSGKVAGIVTLNFKVKFKKID